MNELLLVGRIAGERVAFRAVEVQSVITLGKVTPAPRAPAFVAGLSALRSKPMTVIDCARSLELDVERGDLDGATAVAVEHEGHLYALLVDGVEDVTQAISDIGPVNARLEPGWARVATGTIETARCVLLLVDVVQLIAGPPKKAAA